MRSVLSSWSTITLLFFLVLVSCPKPPPPKVDPEPKTEPTRAPGPAARRDDQFAKCYGQDWTRPEKIEKVLKAQCNDPADPFEPKLQPCFGYDWAKGKLSPEAKAFCEKVGFKERVASCQGYDWRYPDQIAEDDRSFCRKLGFQDIVDPEVCEEQDWTKPDTIDPLLKAQCLKISKIPACGKTQKKTCVSAKNIFFDHAKHGVNLPNKKATKQLNFGDHPITCADCHVGECDPKKLSGTDNSRPNPHTKENSSCAGPGNGAGCHPDFLQRDDLCNACHAGKPTLKNKALKLYGTDVIVEGQQYGFDFSHQSHLSPEGVMKKFGKPPATCADCHSLVTTKKKATSGIKMSQAKHAQCKQCHCDEKNTIKMNDCLSCHKAETEEDVESGHAYLEYRPHAESFKHINHQKGPDNADVKCETCHVAVAETDSIEEIPVPPMLGCLKGCHDGTHTKDKKPAFDGWVKCANCHFGETPTGTTLAEKKKK